MAFTGPEHPNFNQPSQTATRFGGRLGFGEAPGSTKTPTAAPAPKPTPKPAAGSGGLTTDQKNALTVINGILSQYGLQSLTKIVLGYVKQGYNSDAINVLIQQTPEWHQRFAGNDIRAKNGLAPLDPGTYLATEAAYSQALRSNGLPMGFYDGGHDFANWIGNDVSVNEVQQRAQDASSLVDSQDPGIIQALQAEGIDKGHIAAFFLDQKRALPIIQNKYNAVGIGAAAADNHLAVNASQMEKFASMGVTQSQAQNAYQQIAQVLPGQQTLADIYHQAYGQTDIENELLGGSGEEALKRQKLNSAEEAQFSGRGAAGQTLQDPGYGVSVPTAGKF